MLKNKLLSAMGGAPANYIEDVFSTWLYTGNGSTQTINNGIDLAGEGGLVWIKSRSGATYHDWFDTARGVGNYLFSNTTDANVNSPGYDLTAFNSNGFSLGPNGFGGNANGASVASWTFRKAPKFFDVVTWSGSDTSRAINHSLDSVPGCIFVKRIDGAGSYSWIVWHRGYNSGNGYAYLNATSAFSVDNGLWWGDGSTYTAPTSTNFTISGQPAINQSGVNYVAYLFAHNAGGFGLSGEDNVISCGSFTTDGSGAATVNLGYEPQYFLFKRTDSTSNWRVLDVMRGGSLTQSSPLIPNTADVENSFGSFWSPTATGFNIINQAASSTWIYIAIRRGPMKVPESGTSVFGLYRATSATSPSLVSSFPVDMLFTKNPASSGYSPFISSRLTSERRMNTGATDAETTDSTFDFDYQNGALSVDITDYLGWMFRRAPGFFDEVCYTGTGSATTVTHNLTVVPELMIVKSRGNTGQWVVYNKSLGGGTSPEDYVLLVNSTSAQVGPNVVYWNSTNPSSAEFTVGTNSNVNTSGNTYVAYLFASAPGVSKVGSYTGTGTTQTIDCGFAAGSRFVLIKRTDSTGDWYVWDSARGIVAGNDSYLLLNSTAAEVTSTDYIDTYSAGFEISSTAPAAINASGGTFLFLAVA